jgi:outer membrane protein TolC
MKHVRTLSFVSALIALTACSSAPVRDSAALAEAVQRAAGANARLPAADAGYLDAAWFAEPLSADRAVQAALANHPLVRAELTRFDAAQAERIQAGLLRNPMLSAMALRPQGGGRWELDYGLMQSLFDLFARSRRIAVADAVQARTEAEVLAKLLDLAQAAKGNFYRAAAAQARVALLQERLRLDTRGQDLLDAQLRQGAATVEAALRQRAVVAVRAHELRAAEGALVQARAALADSLGLESAIALRLPDAVPVADFGELDAAQLQRLAVAHRPELRAAQAAVRQAQAEIALQRGVLRNSEPALGLAGVRESDGMRLDGIGLQVSLPLLDDGRARAALAATNLQDAQFRAAAQGRQVPLQVEQALQRVAAERVGLAQAESHARQQARLAALSQRNYGDGGSGLAESLSAQLASLDAQEQVLAAQEALTTSLVALERATAYALASD